MKKFLALTLTIVFMLSLGNVSFAQTLDSDVWAIRFDLSDNWSPLYDNPNMIKYNYNTNPGEMIALEQIDMAKYTMNYASTRDAQTFLDNLYDEIYSNATLAENIVSESGRNVTFYVREISSDRRYESYNGTEYYRIEKTYSSSAIGHTTQNWYETCFAAVCAGKLYFISYMINGSYATHFADITNMLNSFVYKNVPGSIIGQALKTDITAKINGHAIASYNVDGYTYVCAEDLRAYGFTVLYDHPSRSLSVSRDYAQQWVTGNYTKPYVAPYQVGMPECAILSTDIVTYFDGYAVPSYNINGQTIIRFNDLAAYGNVNYDNTQRVISLTMNGIY